MKEHIVEYRESFWYKDYPKNWIVIHPSGLPIYCWHREETARNHAKWLTFIGSLND
jgi:hypothetical protein